jgi:hypothetical protein
MLRIRNFLLWAHKAAAGPSYTAILVVLAAALAVIAAGMLVDGSTVMDIASR